MIKGGKKFIYAHGQSLHDRNLSIQDSPYWLNRNEMPYSYWMAFVCGFTKISMRKVKLIRKEVNPPMIWGPIEEYLECAPKYSFFVPAPQYSLKERKWK